jgi:hypothetical protein
MQVKTLKAALGPFKLLCNKNAMSLVYKSLEIAPGHIAGAASYGKCQVKIETGVAATFFVDAWTFINVVTSLADESVLELTTEGPVLNWKAGPSRGKLALVDVKDMPHVGGASDTVGRAKAKIVYKPTPYFVAGLALGSLSCGASSMASAGMYGVTITNSSPAMLVSTDDITCSGCYLDDSLPFTKAIHLSPDAVDVLLSCLTTTGVMEADDTSVSYADDWVQLQVQQVPALKVDIKGVFDAYASVDVSVPISTEAIAAFVKRAAALSDNRRDTIVSMSASKGMLGLSFEQGASSADEVYLVENLDMPDVSEVRLDGIKLARALQHVNSVVLDHMDRGIILLRGEKPEFRYLISARRERKA